MADIDVYVKIIGKIITRGIVGYAPSFFVLGPQFVFGFVNINGNIRDSGSVNHIRIIILQIAGAGNHKFPVHLIHIDLGVFADGTCRMELRDSLPVLFPIGKLFLDLLGSGSFAGFCGKPVGKLFRTVVAQIAAGQFFAFRQSHFLSADRALSLFK